MRIIGTRKPARIGEASYDHGASHYCGPTSLSAITGLGTGTITKIVRRLRRKSVLGVNRAGKAAAVKGMYNAEMLHVLKLLKYRAEQTYAARTGFGDPRVTFAKWADYHADGTSVYLVNITGHYLTYHAGRVVCTSKNGRLHPLSENRHLRKRVKRVWRVS